MTLYEICLSVPNIHAKIPDEMLTAIVMHIFSDRPEDPLSGYAMLFYWQRNGDRESFLVIDFSGDLPAV